MPSRRADGSNEVMSLPDVVILVHGTFAASPDEDGPAWWQRGSEHWRWHRSPGGEPVPAAGAPAAWLAAHQRAVHDRLAAAGGGPALSPIPSVRRRTPT
jgi:hypothetical protein